MDAKLNFKSGDRVQYPCGKAFHGGKTVETVLSLSKGVYPGDDEVWLSNGRYVRPDRIELVTTDTDDQSQKADAGKTNPVLLEVDLGDALAVVNRVLDYGVAKYGERGGWKQVSMDRYEPAARRHRRRRDCGEQFDDESGLDHMAHEITNLLFILQTKIEQNPHTDFLTFNDPPQDHRKVI
jgi:hypothetical protein